jgi:hypothetical protein
MTFQPGDRVRWLTTGDDGFPLVRYGFVGAGLNNGRVKVMLDGEFKGNTVLPADDLAHVHITNVELRIAGVDMLDDPALRQGLVHLWSAEADQAGLDLGPIEFVPADAVHVNGGPIPLALIDSGGQRYVLRACPARQDTIHVKACPAD